MVNSIVEGLGKSAEIYLGLFNPNLVFSALN